MAETQYLVIGGGLAASRAAEQLRKHDPTATITMVSGEPHVPYDRPPLSKEFLRGEKTRADLIYASREQLDDRRIDLRLGTEVTEIDLDGKMARLSDEDTIIFDKALIATGGRPRRPHIPGDDCDGLHVLRTIDDAAALAADSGRDREIVILGAGFIGLEAAASLTQCGARVTVIEAADRVWSKFADPQLADFVQAYCRARGIQFDLDNTVTRIEGNGGRVTGVHTRAGTEHACDAILYAVGITPNVELAARAGLDIDDGIVVNARMATSHPDVFAAGDVVNFPDPVFNKRRRIEHWGHAEYGGQLAGQNMSGADKEYDAVSYVWSDIFDLHLEFAGDEFEHDQTIVRGNIGEGRFTVLYMRRERLTAYFSINGSAKEFSPLKKLIRGHVDLAGKTKQLRDPDVSLRTLL